MKTKHAPNQEAILKAMATAPLATSRSAQAGAVPRSGPIPATKQANK